MGERHPVRRAKAAYVEGNISLRELERALGDRIDARRYKHDARVDGYHSLKGGDTHGYADGEWADE